MRFEVLILIIMNTPCSDVDAQRLEIEHVHEVYEAIAPHFSSTRYSKWPRVVRFLESIPHGSIIADAGCGNGKYLDISSGLYTIGSDRSKALVSICKRKGKEAIVSDVLSLPYRSECFDAVISIAVIHHLSTETRRREAIKEMLRVLRPSGKMLVYVWAFEQTGRFEGKFEDQDALVPWKLPQRFANENSGSSEYHRYYHLFKEGELEQLVNGFGGEIIEHGYDSQNWFAVVSKS